MLGLSSPRAAPPHELGHTSKPTGVSAHLRLDTVLPPACRPFYTGCNEGRHCYYLRVTAALGEGGGGQQLSFVTPRFAGTPEDEDALALNLEA